jgi:chorismate mutase/prephenate dehydrogenase
MTKLTLCESIQYQHLITGKEHDLHGLREALDKIDEELINLLYRRKALVSQVKTLKESQSIPFRDPQREQQIITRIQSLAVASGIDSDVATDIMKLVLEMCK